MAFATAVNRYAEAAAPWRLAREGTGERLATVLYHLVEGVRLVAWHLRPFIPASATEAHRRLCGRKPLPGWGTFGVTDPGTFVAPGPPLFPRYL